MSNFIKAAEGFDIYPSGNIASNYPWVSKDPSNSATIDTTAGMFGGGKLVLATTNATHEIVDEYEFNSTMLLVRDGMSQLGARGLFGVSGWIFGDVFTNNGTFPIISIGNAATGSQYNILGLSKGADGTNVVFPSNFDDITSAPIKFPIAPGTPLWISVKYAYSEDGIYAAYYINGYYRETSLQLQWNTDAMTGAGLVDRLKLWSSSNVSWGIDDMIIQNVSDADPNWDTQGIYPRPSDLPTIPARRIYLDTSVSNGSVDDWESSNVGVANYLAATNGVDHVSADNSNLVSDLYKFGGTAATDILATVFRGDVTMPSMVAAIQKVGATTSDAEIMASGNNRFVGISETDGSVAWTSTSIAAAEFGMKEI